MAEIEYRILGSFEVCRDGVSVPVNAPRQRAVLTALLLEANHVVSVDRLAEQLWGEWPPARARNTIQTLVLRLRRLLEPGRAPGDDGVLVTRQPGYLLRVRAGSLDLGRFEELTAQGRAALAAENPAAAAQTLRQALALWRGEPLADVAGVGLRQVQAPRLRERRLRAIEDRIEADLLLGRHDDLVVELSALIAEHPLRERLYGQLMIALYRSGRQAEALEVFHGLRRRLDEELAVAPGATLHRLYQRILAHDPALSLATGDLLPNRHASPAAVPAQLPLNVPAFTGRGGELALLDDLLARANEKPTAVDVVVISGTAGVGKTALAVRWAHRVSDRFPDGQLYVDLRGFGPEASAMSPEEAVRTFLDAFAVPPQRIPVGLQAQVGLYRSVLAGRRMLVLLDNARDADQVRPLLPGSPGSVVVVTSRRGLPGLVAAQGARPVTLGLLSDDEAREMLTRRLGRDRVLAEPDAVGEIITRCAGLPLALALVAARAATHANFPLGAVASELRAALDALASDDAATDVRAVFSWSYHALSPAAARLFRLLGIHCGPDIAAPAAASLAGVPERRVRPWLAELAGGHLVTEHAPGRYVLHDLLRAYAAELAHAHDTEADRRAASRRALDHYLHTAHAANRRLLEVHLEPIALSEPIAGVAPERVIDHGQAMAWFTAEQPVLLAALRRAADAGFDAHAWRLAWTMVTFLNRRGQWRLQVDNQRLALAAARGSDDREGQAQAHRGLGGVYTHLGRHGDAHHHLRQALDLFTELGEHNGAASAHFGLAYLLQRQGRYEESIEHRLRALDLYRATDHRAGQASALNAIGYLHAHLGGYEKALAYCHQALTLHWEVGNRLGEALTWDSLGYAHHHLGNYQQAVSCYQHALDLLTEIGDRHYETETLVHLGDTYLAVGEGGRAREVWQRALDTLDELGHADAEQVRARLRGLAASVGDGVTATPSS